MFTPRSASMSGRSRMAVRVVAATALSIAALSTGCAPTARRSAAVPSLPHHSTARALDAGIASRPLVVNGTVLSEPLAELATGENADFLRVDRLSEDVLSRARVVARRVENLTTRDVLAALLARVTPIVRRDCRPLSRHPSDFLRTFVVVIDPNGAVLSAAPTGPGGTPREPVTLFESDFSRCVERAMTSAQLGPVSATQPIVDVVPPVNFPAICWWSTPSCPSTVDAVLAAATP